MTFPRTELSPYFSDGSIRYYTVAQVDKMLRRYILNSDDSFLKFPKAEYEEVYVYEDMAHIIQQHIDKSPAVFQKYGTAEDLADALFTFQNFPGSRKFFGFNFIDHFTNITDTKEETISKVNMLPHIAGVVCNQIVEHAAALNIEKSVLCACVGLFFRVHEDKWCDYNEYLSTDWSWIDEYLDKFEDMIKTAAEGVPGIETPEPESRSNGSGRVVTFLSKMLSYDFTEKELQSWRFFLEDNYKSNPAKDMRLVVFCQKVFSDLNAVFNSSDPFWDLLTSRRLFGGRNPSTPVTVRKFIDRTNEKCYIMRIECEMVQFGQATRPTNIPTYNDTQELPLDPDVEFVDVELRRTPHRAVPVMDIHGRPCILAKDAFCEIVRAITMENCYHQFLDRNEMWRFYSWIERMANALDVTNTAEDFVLCKLVDQLVQQTNIEFKTKPKTIERVQMRTCTTDLSCNTIMDEMRHVGLSRFKGIKYYIPSAIQRVRDAAGPNTRLSDPHMFSAIWLCVASKLSELNCKVFRLLRDYVVRKATPDEWNSALQLGIPVDLPSSSSSRDPSQENFPADQAQPQSPSNSRKRRTEGELSSNEKRIRAAQAPAQNDNGPDEDGDSDADDGADAPAQAQAQQNEEPAARGRSLAEHQARFEAGRAQAKRNARQERKARIRARVRARRQARREQKALARAQAEALRDVLAEEIQAQVQAEIQALLEEEAAAEAQAQVQAEEQALREEEAAAEAQAQAEEQARRAQEAAALAAAQAEEEARRAQEAQEAQEAQARAQAEEQARREQVAQARARHLAEARARRDREAAAIAQAAAEARRDRQAAANAKAVAEAEARDRAVAIAIEEAHRAREALARAQAQEQAQRSQAEAAARQAREAQDQAQAQAQGEGQNAPTTQAPALAPNPHEVKVEDEVPALGQAQPPLPRSFTPVRVPVRVLPRANQAQAPSPVVPPTSSARGASGRKSATPRRLSPP